MYNQLVQSHEVRRVLKWTRFHCPDLLLYKCDAFFAETSVEKFNEYMPVCI